MVHGIIIEIYTLIKVKHLISVVNLVKNLYIMCKNDTNEKDKKVILLFFKLLILYKLVARSTEAFKEIAFLSFDSLPFGYTADSRPTTTSVEHETVGAPEEIRMQPLIVINFLLPSSFQPACSLHLC